MVDQFMIKKEIYIYSYVNNQNIWKVDTSISIRQSSEPLSATPDNMSNKISQSTSINYFDDEL